MVIMIVLKMMVIMIVLKMMVIMIVWWCGDDSFDGDEGNNDKKDNKDDHGDYSKQWYECLSEDFLSFHQNYN